ncbi:MAG: molecular chaperone [Acetatifactor sp.]|nr:molecular chaperone [Acetatifactor sp.]
METTVMEQMEALQTLAQFNDRLLKNLPTVISELTGDKKSDTDVYLKNIIDVIGWEISVINATSSLLETARTHMDKEHFNQSVLALNEALSSGADSKIAAALQELVPHFETLAAAAEEVLA